MIALPFTTPTLPVVGTAFTVSHEVTLSGTGALLTAGTMICDPSVDGQVIAHAEHFNGGMATLHFTIPANTQGKLLKVHVTIKLGDQMTTRESYFRILPQPTGEWSYKLLP